MDGTRPPTIVRLWWLTALRGLVALALGLAVAQGPGAGHVASEEKPVMWVERLLRTVDRVQQRHSALGSRSVSSRRSATTRAASTPRCWPTHRRGAAQHHRARRTWHDLARDHGFGRVTGRVAGGEHAARGRDVQASDGSDRALDPARARRCDRRGRVDRAAGGRRAHRHSPGDTRERVVRGVRHGPRPAVVDAAHRPDPDLRRGDQCGPGPQAVAAQSPAAASHRAGQGGRHGLAEAEQLRPEQRVEVTFLPEQEEGDEPQAPDGRHG